MMTNDKLTLRDRFAMAAIDAATQKLHVNERACKNVAHWAYRIADAMIEVRGFPELPPRENNQ